LAIAHYGYVIQTGRIVMQGTGSELLHNDDIKKAYLVSRPVNNWH